MSKLDALIGSNNDLLIQQYLFAQRDIAGRVIIPLHKGILLDPLHKGILLDPLHKGIFPLHRGILLDA